MLKPARIVLWTAALAAVAGFAAAWIIGRGLPDPGRLPLAAQIGGPFELTTQDGSRFVSTKLAGRPFALFFGFTQCPDICPTTLLELSNHLKTLGDAGARLAVVFVSVDPERDRPADLKAYLANFDARIVGLTGTAAEIADIAKAYRAVYEKVPTSGGYTLNHTASVYLMDARGRFAGTLSYQESPAVQIEKLRRLLAQ